MATVTEEYHSPREAPLVQIDWEDITFTDSWNSEDGDELQPLEATTVGWLIRRTPTMVIIASSYNWRDNTWGTVHAIPMTEPQIKRITSSS